LVIEDFGENEELSNCIKDYHRLLQNYLATVHHQYIVHTREEFLPVTW
jgi:hypothetical protein